MLCSALFFLFAVALSSVVYWCSLALCTTRRLSGYSSSRDMSLFNEDYPLFSFFNFVLYVEPYMRASARSVSLVKLIKGFRAGAGGLRRPEISTLAALAACLWVGYPYLYLKHLVFLAEIINSAECYDPAFIFGAYVIESAPR
jgi:hypothetical protein